MLVFGCLNIDFERILMNFPTKATVSAFFEYYLFILGPDIITEFSIFKKTNVAVCFFNKTNRNFAKYAISQMEA